MTQDLVHLARSLKLDELEAEWAKAAESPDAARADDYAAAIDHLCDHDMTSKALSLASTMIEALAGAGANQAAMELGFRVVRRNAHYEALTRLIGDLIKGHYGDESWYAVLESRAGLSSGSTAPAIVEFDRLRRYTKGHVVYHAAGWGEGQVEEFDAANQEITVHFATGRRSAFPLETLLTSFKPLDATDLRAMKLQQMEQLRDEAKNEPTMLIRRAAALYRGTITSQQVKNELAGSIIADKSWATYWKRARSAATKDPWLKVEGSTTRPVFVLRTKPVGVVEEATAALHHQNDLGQRIGVLREYLARGQDTEVRTQILDLALKVVEQAMAEDQATHAHILDGLLFLEEHGRQASIPAAQEVRALLQREDGSLDPDAIDRLATQESREHCVALLPAALGENWVEQCAANWTGWPNSVAEVLVDQIVANGQALQLLPAWTRIAPYPRRYPLHLYLLGRLYAEGAFGDDPDRPDPVTVGRVLLHLGRILNEDRKKNLLHSRLLSRLTSLLCGKRGLLHLALDGISREDIAHYHGILRRAGEDFSPEISDTVDRVILSTYPDIIAEPEIPFWEKENIFTTADGLRRIKEEYRILVDEKIPTNSKAIGAAASLGDLSENSEWESAMEEQRNLTSRAQEMDRDIRSARLIEDQDIPEGIVTPGTEVTIANDSDGAVKTYRVLGPWDSTDDVTVNYKAPVAQSLLGKSVGDTAEIPTASGPAMITIQAIERIV
ncbi:MAG: GreA/GreB family elongation factor [Planctomycetes bacterium]|nr:GreA/GreB family elongation factor [Planctomycetota bacterium]